MRWVEIGDELGDFEVVDIAADRVVLKTGSKTFDVPVYDKDKPKARTAVVAEAKPTIITTSATKGSSVTQKGATPARTRAVRKKPTSRSREEARRLALEKLRRARAQTKK